MRDILDGLIAWRARGEPFALATVINTWSSAPRPAGTTMAVSSSGEVLGSISGGCVEGATYDLAQQAIESREATLTTFGVTDDDAFAVGLTCGGVIDVFVAPVTEDQYSTLDSILDAVKNHRPIVVATVTSGAAAGRRLAMAGDGRSPSASGEVDSALQPWMPALMNRAATDLVHLGPTAGDLASATVFLQSFAPPPRMIVFGAIDFAASVAGIGKFLGYDVTVCDARATFATPARFPGVDRLVVDWPHRYLRTQTVEESTVLCVLTHDPKFDIPLLKEALASPARYVGVMGSRRTHAKRLEALRAEGVPDWQLERLCSPIGHDLGARTSEETAVSIAAEIIASASGATGVPLRQREGAIHR